MAQTYRFTNTTAGITVNATTTNDLVTTTGVGSDNITASNAGSVASFYYVTPAGNPGASGTTGNYTIVTNVSSAAGSTQARVYVHRVNSSGAIQNSSAATAYQSTATTGDKTYTFTSQALGTWATGDRLAVQIEVQNNNAHGGAVGPTYDWTATNSRVDAPWTLSNNFQQAVSGTLSFSGARPVVGVSRAYAGSLTPSGALIKRVSTSLTAALSFTGNIATQVVHFYQQALTATLTFSGSFAGRVTTFHQALTAVVDFVTAMTPVKSGSGMAALTARHIHPAD